MQVSLSALKLTVHPTIWPILIRLIANDARRTIDAGGDLAALADASGGTDTGTAAVNTPTASAYAGGASLADRAAWNAAISTANSGAATILARVNAARTRLGMPAISLSGVPAGGVGAVSDVVGTDGAGNTGLLRSEAAAQVTALRNNLSTVIRAYNDLAVTIAGDTVEDKTGGKASDALVPVPAAATGVGSGGDAVSLAQANAILAAVRNSLATVVARINEGLDPVNLSSVTPITLRP